MRNKHESRMPSTTIVLAAAIFIAGIIASAVVPAAGEWLTTRNLSDDERALKKLSHVMRIAPGDPPRVTTVSDVSKLRGQTFFRYAENGDKVFIFNSAEKAVLFRPSTGIIVDVAPIRMVK